MNERRGPDPKTLRNLAQMLPKFTKHIVEGRVTGRGQKVVPTRKATKVCPVCMIAHDYRPSLDESLMKTELCGKCGELLADGYIAFVCAGQYAFGRHDHLSDLAGTIQKVNQETFDKLATKFRAQRREPTAGQD